MTSVRTLRALTIGGLVLGAAGISLLWAGGVEFPVAVPPGILILLAGALFVAFAPWRWAPATAVLLGAFITVGFLISGSGFDNIAGERGATVAVGQSVQLIGVWIAAVGARTLVPRLAGMNGVPYRRFAAWHTPAAVGWSLWLVVGSYLAGASYDVLAARAEPGRTAERGRVERAVC